MTIPHVPSSGRLQPNGAEVRGAGDLKTAIPRFPSAQILGTTGEAEIEHDGHLYRLRRTSRGGLVLTK